MLLLSATPAEADLLKAQIQQFEQLTTLNVETLIVPFKDFDTKLAILLAAGTPPDIAVLSYNQVVSLQQRNQLQPLQISDADMRDFLPDALSSNSFSERLFALPWVRSACLPRYRNLGVFAASKFPTEAFKLVDFLTQQQQQEQNFKVLQNFPTRQSVQRNFNLTCPEPAIYRFPEDVDQTVALVAENRRNLEPLLNPILINIYESVPLKQENELKGAAAAVTDPIDMQDMAARLKDGIYVGALFLRAPLQIRDEKDDVVQTIEPGNYAVRWQGDVRPTQFFLVRPNGDAILIPSARFEPTQGPVGPPTVLLLRGSFPLCWWADGNRICIYL
jgi:ABC-type glycerol-3-phosphate transport system substrate-binding protein